MTETADIVWAVASRKAVDPDELPAELVKLILDDDSTARSVSTKL